jgi:hypothetical protein
MVAMMGKSDEITEAKMKLRQLENRVNRLMQAQNTELRKQRTRRLIERGAILESMIDGAENITNDQIMYHHFKWWFARTL